MLYANKLIGSAGVTTNPPSYTNTELLCPCPDNDSSRSTLKGVAGTDPEVQSIQQIKFKRSWWY